MTDDQTDLRWDQLQTLFETALDLSGEARERYLNDACGADGELRRDVEALLNADATGGLRVQNVIRRAASRALVTTAGGSNMIGPYTLIREIGHGGMGAVHLAERSDDEFQQRVAIKLLHRSMVAPEFLARFRSERQILADLNHPNIAHLIDGGTTDDGVPYFVMEYVEGKPIHQYCDDNQLSIDERLDLFRTICSAIEMAHQNLIVHRDIKPNNILVSRDGIPKLLDFGIAKSLGEPQEGEAITQLGDRILTPNHASPEQVMGRTATTASDVYSLGVLLYELLCGVCPFNLNGCSPAEMEKIVTQLEAETPSQMLSRDASYEPPKGRTRCPEVAAVAMDRGTSVDRLRRKLRGDIDNIVLKALHKDRARRYRSVGRLSEDIRRYLRGLPVQARPDRFGYRASKFIQRNRWSVAAGAAFVVSLGLFSAVTFFQAKELATKNQRLSALVNFNVDILSPADPYNMFDSPDVAGDEEGAAAFEAILDRASDRLQRASGQYSALEFTTLQHVVGMINYHMNRTDEARNLFQQALVVREAELGREAPELIELLVQLSHVDWVTRDLSAVCDLANRAYDIARQNFVAPHALLALTQGNLANYARKIDYLDQDGCAIVSGQSVETLFTEALANYSESDLSEEVADTWRAYGNLLNNLGRSEETLVAADQALRVDREIYGPKHVKVALDYSLKAVALMRQRKYDEVAELMDAAIEIHEEAVRARPRLQKRSLVRAYWIRGQLHEKTGEYDKSFADYRRSQLYASQLPNGQEEVGKALHGMAQSLARLGRTAEAEPLFAQAVEAFGQADGATLGFQATLGIDYGAFLRDVKRLDDARKVYLDALSLMGVEEPSAHGPLPQSFVVGVLLSGLGEVEAMACNVDQATVLQTNAVKLLEATIPGFPQTELAQQRLRSLPPAYCTNAARL